MKKFLSRLFNWGKSEANSLMDKLENPIKIYDQEIRNQKEKLENALESLAKLKASTNKTKANEKKMLGQAKEWKSKANALLDKVDNDSSLKKEDGERLVIEALNKHENLLQESSRYKEMAKQQDSLVKSLDAKIQKLRNNIKEAEKERDSLKARADVAKVSKDINKELSTLEIDNSNSVLQRMREKVEEDEALAVAYEELGDGNMDVESEIEAILGKDSPTANSELLANLRQERDKKAAKA